MKIRLLIPLFLIQSVASLAAAQTVEVQIDASKTSAPISKYVYGQFIEHIGGLMNTGIWAELLDDRKFYNSIPTPVPTGSGPRFNRTRLRPWTIVGPTTALKMDGSKPFVGKHSPKIMVAGDGPRGIEQGEISVVAGKTYTGRIFAASSSGAKVSVALVWGSRPTDRATVALGALGEKFKKANFSFKVPVSVENARFQILGTGTGEFSVGAVSMMAGDNVEGFRPEVIKVLRELHSGVYRFPGGNFVSAHEWRDAIGDIDKRVPKLDPVWNAVQPNDFGTEEFMRFCRLVDVDPYITVSAGFGDARSARDYVEYCNGSASTPMGQLRAKNGHRAPYNVKYWGIGNEMWGYSYQFGAMKLNQYVYKHNEFADAMRAVDPTIKLIGSGAMADTMTGSGEALNLGDSLIPKPLGPADWTGVLLQKSLDKMELISEHFYNYGATHYDLGKAKQVPNDPNEPLVQWMRRPANHVRLKVEEYEAYEKLIPGLKEKPVPICLDEWAYSGGPPNSFKVVPAYAWTFHEMFRRSDLYQMACFTFATALFNANRTEAVLNPGGMVFKLYRDHFGTIPVAVSGNSPQPKPTEPTGGEQPAVNAGSATFPLDVSAAWNADHTKLTVAVINPTETEQSLDLKTTGANFSGKGDLWRMAPDKLDAVVAVGRAPEVKVDHLTLSAVPSRLMLPKHSVSIYVFETR